MSSLRHLASPAALAINNSAVVAARQAAMQGPATGGAGQMRRRLLVSGVATLGGFGGPRAAAADACRSVCRPRAPHTAWELSRAAQPFRPPPHRRPTAARVERATSAVVITR